jgi:hypothetical protein
MVMEPLGRGYIQPKGSSVTLDILTLKPMITTPIWAVIISRLHGSSVDAQLIAVWSILPGAGLTVLALVIFWRLFFGSRALFAILLIVSDCMRWISSGLLTVTITLPYNRAPDTRTGIFALIGLIFPTVYSVIALATTLATNEVQTAALIRSEQNVGLATTGPTCRPCSLTLTPSLRVIEIQLRRIVSMTILSHS